jgi:hypothetical protein
MACRPEHQSRLCSVGAVCRSFAGLLAARARRTTAIAQSLCSEGKPLQASTTEAQSAMTASRAITPRAERQEMSGAINFSDQARAGHELEIHQPGNRRQADRRIQ